MVNGNAQGARSPTGQTYDMKPGCPITEVGCFTHRISNSTNILCKLDAYKRPQPVSVLISC